MKKLPFLLFILLIIAGCSQNSPSTSPRFNHVMLYVMDLEKSIDFYTKAFDLTLKDRVSTLQAHAEDGSVTDIAVNMAFLKYPNQDFILEISQNGADSDTLIAKYQHLGIDVLDIESAFEKALTAGAVKVSDIRTVSVPGIKAKNAFMLGPDGESIELMEMLEGEF